MSAPNTAPMSDCDALSDLDTRVLLSIVAFHKFNGYPPTLREVARMSSTDFMRVARALRRLRKCELVTWEHGRARTLRALVEVTVA